MCHRDYSSYVIGEVGSEAKAGQLVRCVDIDAQVHDEHGIYNDLHGFKSGAELSNYLKGATSKCYGVAAEEFIKRLIEDENADQSAEQVVISTFDDMRRNICEKFNLGKDVDGQVQRVSDIFALLATTGTLASVDRLGVLTHNASGILESIFAVFGSWLKDRGGDKSMEEQNIVEDLKGYLSQNEHRFYSASPEFERINIPLGYILKETDYIKYEIFPKIAALSMTP